MALLTILTSKRSGDGNSIAAGVACNAGGDSFANDGSQIVVLKNASAGVITVTFVTPITVDGLAVTDLTVSVPATTGMQLVGPFPPAWYNDASGLVQMTYSGVTSLTVSVLKVTPG